MTTLYDLTATGIDGSEVDLGQFRGKVALVVNTASKCGFTPQYKGLEALHQDLGDQGLVVLGFPCDQFGHQEPGDEDEIAQFCELNYGVTFPLFAKVDVNGRKAHPVFRFLRSSKSGVLGDRIKWNFTKFLVDAEGIPVRRYGTQTTPEQIRSDIEALLT